MMMDGVGVVATTLLYLGLKSATIGEFFLFWGGFGVESGGGGQGEGEFQPF